MANPEAFKQHVIDSGIVLDPEGTHHEFVSGMHGQKLDFDNIPDDTPLYREWVDTTTRFLVTTYDPLPKVIVGVANGTNRLARDVGTKLFGYSHSAPSAKDPENSKRLYLPDWAGRLIAALTPELVVVLEDVGTTGSNSVQVAQAVLDAGAQSAEVVVSWQRREQLERLDEAEVPYRAVIYDPLPTFTPEACAAEAEGFCARNWKFIPRTK